MFSYSYISKPGIKVNEDRAFACKDFGWVLDGSTGLNKKKYSSEESDALWFVNSWNKYLLNNLGNKLDLKEILNTGLESIREDFYRLSDEAFLNKLDRPSASLGLVKFNNDKLQYLLLGDCTLLIEDMLGTVKLIKDRSVEKLDKISIDNMVKLMAQEGISLMNAKERIKDILIKHRNLKNTANGYWVLEFENDALDNSIYGEVDINSIKKIMIMSDGFSSIIDSYRLLDEYELLDLAEKNGLEHVYNIIKDVEEKDSEAIKYPRLKKSDDASAVLYEKIYP